MSFWKPGTWREPFLLKYLSTVKAKPEVTDTPAKYKGKKEFNIIYNVWDSVYVHAFSSKSPDGFNQYNIIEPPRPDPRFWTKLN